LQTSCMAVVVIDDEDIRNAGKNSISWVTKIYFEQA
jgi:hypothetical protein